MLWTPQWGVFDSKVHLDWLKIDLNVVEIITVQDYEHIKNMNGSHIYNVKAKSQASNILVRYIMTSQKSQIRKKIR